MKRFFVLAVLLFPAAVFAVWILLLSNQVQSGELVRIQVEGYDPRDLLSGHYILYQNSARSVDENIQNTSCRRQDFDGAQRFYIPQANAAELDSLFRSRRRYFFEVVYSCVKGKKPIATQLLIDGVDWRKFLNEFHRER